MGIKINIKIINCTFGFHDIPDDKPIVVSGYGMTEYEIRFCKKCNKGFIKLTKNFNNG